MIVKDEAKLILRCLESVKPLVDYVLISDTGSTDGTQKVIRDWLYLNKIEGVVLEHAWQDFSYNRNLAIENLRNRNFAINYAFVIDADDRLEIAPDFNIAAFKARMDRDIYDLMVLHGGVVHPRPQIFRNKPGYYYVGVLHEYLEAPKPFTRVTVSGLKILASIEGSRNADPQKFRKDAEILKKAVKSEQNAYLRARYMFYLAQSYRDANDPKEALRHYLIRSNTAGGWDQEVYVSLLEAIRCHTKCDGPNLNDPVFWFERAAKLFPERIEAHHAMAFLCRKHGANQQGMEISRRGFGKTVPDGLFVEPWIYDYGLLDEFAVNAYWAGHYLESLQASLMLLANEKTPHHMVKRLADNAIAALGKLPALPFSD
jgi:glycosyltransferase involved in cell wall biosynthesis